MKKYSLIFLLLLLSSISYSQDSTKINSYWENGKQKVQGTLINGERDGYWIEYNSDGTKSMEGEYELGLNVGLWKYYCKHGLLSKEVKWLNDKIEGIYLYFPDGSLEAYVLFDYGIKKEQYLILRNNIELARNAIGAIHQSNGNR